VTVVALITPSAPVAPWTTTAVPGARSDATPFLVTLIAVPDPVVIFRMLPSVAVR
jgi:hypothetical protein